MVLTATTWRLLESDESQHGFALLGGHVDAVMRDGAERAEALAVPVLAEVYDVVGFLNVRR